MAAILITFGSLLSLFITLTALAVWRKSDFIEILPDSRSSYSASAR